MAKHNDTIKFFESDVLAADIISDEIIRRAEKAIAQWDRVGHIITVQIIPPGTFLYRSRKCSAANCQKIRDFGAPPNNMSKIGRANPNGRSVFYASNVYESTFFEIGDLRPDDRVVCSVWQVNKPIVVAQLGFSTRLYELMNFPHKIPPLKCEDKDLSVSDALGLLFCAHNDYNLSSKIFEIHTGDKINNIEKLIEKSGLEFPKETFLAGVSYPTLRLSGSARNFALQPDIAEVSLSLFSAREYRVDEIFDAQLETTIISTLDSPVFDPVKWRSGEHLFVVREGRTCTVTAKAGVDEFGWYLRLSDGRKGFWRAELEDGTALSPEIAVKKQ